jgi:hypothetical protein
MLNSPRWLMVLVSTSFATFHAVLGALAWEGYDNDYLLTLSIVVYLATVVMAVGFRKGLAMGPVLGALTGVGAVATAVIANLGISAGETGTYASWYVGGMGVLLGVAAIRGEALVAWVSAALVVTVVVQAAGLAGIGSSGVVGMVVLIAAGQATARALRRADREVEELQQAEILAQAATISAEAAGVERRERLQKVLTRALPALSYISSKNSVLDADERGRLLQLEASLRDDIRGRRLINDEVAEAARLARQRGVQVLLMDEGGLDGVIDIDRALILDKVAAALNSVDRGKVVVRSPRGEKWLVTVAATRPGTSSPDLWLKF